MKDSLLLRKKIRPRKFVKSKPKINNPEKKGEYLRQKIKNLKKPLKQVESGVRNQESWFSKIKRNNFLIPDSLFIIRKTFRSPNGIASAFPPKAPRLHNDVIKRFELDLQLLLIPAILLIILAIIIHFNKNLTEQIAAVNLNQIGQSGDIHPYPLVDAATQPPILSAKAAIVLDAESQVPVFSKNPDLRFSMASTTKLMTVLIALQHYKPDDILTVKSFGIPGTILGLIPGQRFTFLNLMYAMLLPSDNDAAVAIADNYPGGQTAFVKAMNEKAAQLHLTNTHYADPDGLDDDGDYTTVIDMSRLASVDITYPLITQITSTKQKVITDASFTRSYVLTNSNELLGIDGITGLKTGTTEGAGEVLVTTAVVNDHTYILVVMDSTNRFADTEALLAFVRKNVHYVAPNLTPYH